MDKAEWASRKDLARRTMAYAIQIVRLYPRLPRTAEAQVLGKQVLRSGTSVGAQYREGVRARSPAEFLSKIQGALQELEETDYWLELMVEGGVVQPDLVSTLRAETNELIAIFVTSVKTAKAEGQAQPSR